MGTSWSQARLRFSERRADQQLESKLGKVTLPQKKKKKGVYLKRQGEVIWYMAAQSLRTESGPDVFTTKGY